jgi:hypothetical protein
MGNGVLCRNFSSEASRFVILKREIRDSRTGGGESEANEWILSEAGGASGVAAGQFLKVSGAADRI